MSRENIYESGLNGADWHYLAYSLIYATHRELDRMQIPDHLREHEVAKLIREGLENDDATNAFTRAAHLLVPGSDSPWGVIMKH